MKKDDVKYYYCEDMGKYVKYDDGFYSLEKDGTLKHNDFYAGILIGDIWVRDITEDEFNAQLV